MVYGNALPDGRRKGLSEVQQGMQELEKVLKTIFPKNAKKRNTLKQLYGQDESLLEFSRKVRQAREQGSSGSKGGRERALSSYVRKLANEALGASSNAASENSGRTSEPTRPGRGNDGPNQLDLLMDQLIGLAGQQRPTVNYKAALKGSQQAIRDAYGHEIKGIRRHNKRARRDTAEGREEVEGMYEALGRSYNRAAKQDSRQGKRAANQMARLAENLTGQMSSQANANADMLGQRFNELGQQKEGGEALTESAAKTENAINQSLQQGLRQAGTARNRAENNRRFLNKEGQVARFEGTNRSADMQSALQDYLQDQRAEIQGLRGQKRSELASNASQIAAAVAEAEASQPDMFERYMDLAQLRQSMDQTAFDNNLAKRKFNLDQQKAAAQNSGTKDLSSFLPKNQQGFTQMLQTIQNPEMRAALSNLQRSPEFINGQVEIDGKSVPLNQFSVQKFLENYLEEAGIRPGNKELEKARMAAMLLAGG